jgi:hypothetical protein
MPKPKAVILLSSGLTRAPCWHYDGRRLRDFCSEFPIRAEASWNSAAPSDVAYRFDGVAGHVVCDIDLRTFGASGPHLGSRRPEARLYGRDYR